MVVVEFRISESLIKEAMRKKKKGLQNLSYAEFGMLRFLDHFPKTREYYLDDSEGLECGIGLGCMDGYGLTGFVSQPKSGKTCEISLDFWNRCPPAEGNAFLQHLGLEVRKGMTKKQVEKALGRAKEKHRCGLDYVMGSRWPYYVRFIFANGRMVRVWICRKDLADRARRTMYL